jgi:predicted small lipoprotein YifL
MSGSFSTERSDRSAAGRRLVLALLALGPLAACGKKAPLRLPKPGEPGYEPTESKAKPQTQPEAQPQAEPKAQP